ncbi:MAG: acetyl-CoA carboxylase biotin carboxyl carrier protein subunit [Armatimonadota bacterium]|nr:acetyl-CoA carboxylase biotin carboxyl carrier protein subunit [Armatimonadota bacterium]
MDLLQELVKIVKDSGIGELTVRVGDWRVTIRKHSLVPPPTGAGAAGKVEERSPAPTVAEEKTSRTVPVKSGWVGIVKRSLDGKGLVRVGDTVRKGQTICWVDSLGITNEVRAPENGRIVEILVEDGQPVEYGQVVMSLEVETSESQ